MLASWTVILSALVYLCALFAVAHIGDISGKRLMEGRWRTTIHALALAVYCTSWTFFGSVGLASRSGLDFFAIYIGPIIVVGLGWPVIARIVRLAKAQNITSIADFVASRYGKSERVAALVAVIAVVGAVPYIALQLKAVSTSLEVFLAALEGSEFNHAAPLFGDLALVVAMVLAAFAMAFGTRHIDATEHQDGLVFAIALESVVKLVAFLAVGLFVTYWMFDGFGDIVRSAARVTGGNNIIERTSDIGGYLTLVLLSACAALMLPRQFHMAVVENRDPADVKRAGWMFPLYLIAINIFVVPLALAGEARFANGTIDRDMTVLALPLHDGAGLMALVAFIGGLSAATAMVIVDSVALAIMISNDLVMPLVVRRRGLAGGEMRDEAARQGKAEPGLGGDLGGLVLIVRRIAIVVVILLAYAYYRAAGAAALASIGLLSFAAVAQIAPAFVGGLVWRRGTARGASAGILVGSLVWAYTLLLPSLSAQAGLWTSLVEHGPFGVEALRPTALFGLDMARLSHGVAWSLGLNILSFIGFSLLRPASPLERLQANIFVARDSAPMAQSFRFRRSPVTLDDLTDTVSRYLGEERTRRSFETFARERGLAIEGRRQADIHVVRFAEHLLASAIGAASSRLVLSFLLRRGSVSTKAALKLIDDASAAIQYNRDILQNALDHARQGITVLDRDLRLVAWNRVFRDLYDLPVDLVRVGVGLDEIVAFNARRGTYGAGKADELIAARLESFVNETEPVRLRLHPSGNVIEIRSNHLPDGGLVTTYTDITETVEAEEALASANETLERRVTQRTEELTRLNVELTRAKAGADEANASKTRFLAAASHDILQPLNAARLYATSLVERDRAAGEATLAENIDASLDAVEEILTALLDISRLDTGALKAEFSALRIDEMLRQLQREFEPLAAEKGLALAFVPSSLTVRSDRRLLRRLLQNLISNAIKYTPSGKVLVGCRRLKGKLRIEVWDTGLGIPASKQRIVFREFLRLEQGARAARGHGLGLSIVERIARVLDHKVTLRSAPGRGSTFAVELATAAPLPAMATPAEKRPTPAAPLAGLCVLAIDNEPAITDGMRALLGGWGCTVVTATSLKEAIMALKRRAHPDVIVADYHLDEGDGIEAIVSLRWKLGRALPAILLTADRSPSVRDEAAGKDIHVLHKPLKPAALRALLAQWRATRMAAE
jgi:Na+/proline symporter/signal transduction histidine kinase